MKEGAKMAMYFQWTISDEKIKESSFYKVCCILCTMMLLQPICFVCLIFCYICLVSLLSFFYFWLNWYCFDDPECMMRNIWKNQLETWSARVRRRRMRVLVTRPLRGAFDMAGFFSWSITTPFIYITITITTPYKYITITITTTWQHQCQDHPG